MWYPEGSNSQSSTEQPDGVTVHRKYKCGEHGRKARWWFILHGSESTLTNIEKRWNIMEIQTEWKIEHCYQPSDASNTNSDEPSDSSNETDELTPQNHVAIPPSNEIANQQQSKECDEAAQSETPPLIMTPRGYLEGLWLLH